MELKRFYKVSVRKTEITTKDYYIHSRIFLSFE